MNGRETNVATFRQCPPLRARLAASSLLIFFLLFSALPARSATPQVPWECSTYEGDAQTRCLNAFIESQQERIGQLEGQLQAQQSTVGQLKSQIESQAATTTDLQRQLSARSAASVAPIPYAYTPYPYFYPPSVGFGFYLGSPWMYGSPFYYRPFWGPRFHPHWGHRR